MISGTAGLSKPSPQAQAIRLKMAEVPPYEVRGRIAVERAAARTRYVVRDTTYDVRGKPS